MFIKKTALLLKRGGGKPLTVKFKMSAGEIAVSANARGTLGILTEKGASFGEMEMGECRILCDVSETFAASIFDGGKLVYFADFGLGGDSVKRLKEEFDKTLENREVKIEYNDYAIAEENYFARFREDSNSETRDSGDFSKGGNGTQYQDNEKNLKEEDKPHDRFFGAQELDDKAAQAGEEEAGDKADFGEDEEGDCNVEYYEKISESLNALICSYPREKELERLFPGSSFVRIPYRESKYYIAGLKMKDGRPQYVVYGVPAKRGGNIPEEFGGGCFVGEKDTGYLLLLQSVADGSVVSGTI